MAGINYANLVKHFRTDAVAAGRELRESLQKKEFRPRDFNDLGALFEACFGWEEYKACKSGKSLANDVFARHGLLESGGTGAVSTSAFQAISGQIVYSAVLEGWEMVPAVVSPLIPEVPTQFLDGEKIAGVTNIGDEGTIVYEGQPYPVAGVSEDYINTPPLRKRGLMCAVTREAVFADRTGQLLERCNGVGESLRYADENRAIDCLIDENTGAVSALNGGHRYHRRGNSIATYGNNSGTHDWDNLQASNTLLDYTDIENAELLLDAMTDPGTGLVTGKFRAAAQHLVVTTQLVHTAKQILHATEVRVHVTGYPTSGNPIERASANTLQTYTIVTSPMLAGRLATDTHWFLGNISKAFRKMVAWKLETTQAPSNSYEEFHRDIVAQYKAGHCDAYTTFEPRYMIQNTVA